MSSKVLLLLLPLFTCFEIQVNTSYHHLFVQSAGRSEHGNASEDGKVLPLTLPRRSQVALGYPAQHCKAVSDLLITKRDCSNTAVALRCLINDWEDLCTVSALSKCQCLCHVAYKTSKRQPAGCGRAGPACAAPSSPHPHHVHAPVSAHAHLLSPS